LGSSDASKSTDVRRGGGCGENEGNWTQVGTGASGQGRNLRRKNREKEKKRPKESEAGKMAGCLWRGEALDCENSGSRQFDAVGHQGPGADEWDLKIHLGQHKLVKRLFLNSPRENTLSLFICRGGNLRQTARALGVHRPGGDVQEKKPQKWGQ